MRTLSRYLSIAMVVACLLAFIGVFDPKGPGAILSLGIGAGIIPWFLPRPDGEIRLIVSLAMVILIAYGFLILAALGKPAAKRLVFLAQMLNTILLLAALAMLVSGLAGRDDRSGGGLRMMQQVDGFLLLLVTIVAAVALASSSAGKKLISQTESTDTP